MGRGQDQAVTSADKPITTTVYDSYYVAIMVDAAHPEKAFKLKAKVTYDAGIEGGKTTFPYNYHDPIPSEGEPGHMLYYVVKNKIIQAVFSLGPRDPSNALNGIRGLATADCSMKAMCYAFKFDLSSDKAMKLINDTNKKRKLVADGELKYNALVNDTCASVALDILRPYLPQLPKGKGPTGTINITFNAVTPYWLFEDFKKVGTPYRIYPTNKILYTKEYPKKLLPNKYKIFYAGHADEVLW